MNNYKLLGIFSHDKEYFQNIVNFDKLNPKKMVLNEKVCLL